MSEKLQKEMAQWKAPVDVWRAVWPTCIKTAMLGMFLCYSLVLINGYNSPDGPLEGTYYYYNDLWQGSCGRWMIGVLSGLGGSMVMPAVFLSFNALCIAVAVTLLSDWWQLRTKWWLVLATLSLVTAPTLISTNLFFFTSYKIGFDILVYTLAAYLLLTKKGVLYYALSVLCMVLGLATYQGDIGITIGLIMMSLMFACLEERPLPELGRTVARVAGAGVSAFVVYYLSMHLWSAVSGVPLAKRGGLNEMNPLSLLLGVPGHVRNCYHNFKEYFYILGTNKLGKILLFCLLCAVLVLGVGLLKLVLRRRAQAVVLLVCGLLLPMGLGVIYLSADFGFGINMSMPMQFVIPFALALAERSRPLVFAGVWPSRLIRLATCGGVATLCWVCCITAYATYYSFALCYNYVDTVATGLLIRIMGDENYTPDTRVMIGGAPDEMQAQKFNFMWDMSLYQGDMVIWNNGTGILGGWEHYLYDYHGFFPGEVTLDEYYAIADSAEYAAMPLYPAEGSIKMFDDIMVVKLQDDLPR